MKKFVCSVLCLIFLCSPILTVRAANKADKPEISAEAYILYCTDNGQIICSKNENKRMKPASTTKIMTSLIALEQASAANKEVTFTNEMAAEGSSMYLKAGDKVTLTDLASGMMMASGNDAANAAAITISGGFEKFSKLMNERAKQIGMSNTHFVTPSGLDDDNHYSTAYDMALLMSFALENEDFSKLTSQKSAAVSFINPASKKTTYANHNRLLSMYEYCIGGKTGYTKAAGRCLVSAAKKDGLTLVCVTLNDRNDWNDHTALYEYGFDKYSYYQTEDALFCAEMPCVGGDSNKTEIMGEKSGGFVILTEDKNRVVRKVYAPQFLYAPVKQNDIAGRIDYILDNNVVYSTNLIAANAVSLKKEDKNIFTIIKELFTYG